MAGLVYDKLSIINDCLIATGNNTCLLEDGSTEWIVASSAYERYLPDVLYKHDWTFQTKILIDLPRIGKSTMPGYCDIYAKPADCLHLQIAWRTDLGDLMPKVSSFSIGGDLPRVPPLPYDIIGDQIHCTAPLGLSCKYVMMPGTVVQWPPGFVETLRMKITAVIESGLNEDLDAAKAAVGMAGTELAEARARVDQEKPRRSAYRSRLLEMRQIRRAGWGW